MPQKLPFALISIALLLLISNAFTPVRAAPKVVASISPVHSLAAGVMQGVAQPKLLIRGAASPHAYALRPSDARLLKEADLIFWIDPKLEGFLAKPLKALAGLARVTRLSRVSGISHQALARTHSHGYHPKHIDGYRDMHIWLDPANAAAMVRKMVKDLRELDPANSVTYVVNGDALRRRLDSVTADINAKLRTVQDRPFVVLHDAYRHFAFRFRLNLAGALSEYAELSPGAKGLRSFRRLVNKKRIACIFGERRAQPALLRTAAEGTSAGSGTLDALGIDLTPGPDAYFRLLSSLAQDFARCLVGPQGGGRE